MVFHLNLSCLPSHLTAREAPELANTITAGGLAYHPLWTTVVDVSLGGGILADLEHVYVYVYTVYIDTCMLRLWLARRVGMNGFVMFPTGSDLICI